MFLNYCNRNESFGDRLVSLGLKCPMHQSNSPQMREFTRIAADLLTTEHKALTEMLIRPTEPPQIHEGINDHEEETGIEPICVP